MEFFELIFFYENIFRLTNQHYANIASVKILIDAWKWFKNIFFFHISQLKTKFPPIKRVTSLRCIRWWHKRSFQLLHLHLILAKDIQKIWENKSCLQQHQPASQPNIVHSPYKHLTQFGFGLLFSTSSFSHFVALINSNK